MEYLLERYLNNAQTRNADTVIEGANMITSKTVPLNKKQNVQKIPFSCYACFETFTVEVDFEKLNIAGKKVPVEFEVVCQSCGLKGIITMKMSGPWSCDYCRRKFPTREEAEFHEEICEFRGITSVRK